MSNEKVENNVINEKNKMPEEENFTNGGQNGSELNKDLNQDLNQDIHNMPNNNGNSDINIKDNNSPEQQNLIPSHNISNISNPSNEEIIQKINSFLQQKKFLNKNIIN
jgi:hypothetical protein